MPKWLWEFRVLPEWDGIEHKYGFTKRVNRNELHTLRLPRIVIMWGSHRVEDEE